MTQRALLISTEKQLSERIKGALAPSITMISVDPITGDVATAASQFQPDIILVDSAMQLGVHTAYERITGFRNQFPALPLLVIGSEGSAQLVLAAMRAGADDFVDRDCAPAEFRSVVTGYLEQRGRAKRDSTALQLGVLSASAAEEDHDFAVNLATTLASHQTDKNVVLVDLSLPESLAGIALNIDLAFTVHDAVKDMGRLDRALLESALARCPRSGLYVLPLATGQSDGWNTNAQDIKALLQILHSTFDVVVVFYGPFSYQRELVDLNDLETTYFLSCNQRLSSVKAATRLLARVSGGVEPTRQPVLVIHEFARDLFPDAEDIHRTLGLFRSLHLNIRWEDLAASVNRGVPLAMADSSPYTRQIEECLRGLDILGESTKSRADARSFWQRVPWRLAR